MIRRALSNFWNILRHPPIPFKLAVVLVAAVLYGASGYIYFERLAKPEITWADGFWWAVVTMTTVGYGDHFPVTNAGRFLIAYPLMLLGMGFMGFGLAELAGFVLRADLLNRKGLMMSTRSEQIVVCNYGSRGRFMQLLRELRSQPQLLKHPVLLIDRDLETLPTEIAELGVQFIKGHPGRIDTLRRANLQGSRLAVVIASDPNDPASDDFTTTICLSLKTLYPELRLVAECVDPDNQETMARSGCDSIVCVMSLGPGILAQELHDPGVVQVLEELTIWDDDVNNIFIVPVSVGGRERTVADLRTWADEHVVTVLGIRADEKLELNPRGDRVIQDGESAVVMTPLRPKEIWL